MQHYTLTELSHETGVPARRIRYWIHRGLVPRSVNDGVPRGQRRGHKTGTYTYAHVRRILAVRDFFDQPRSIADAVDHFNPLFPERP